MAHIRANTKNGKIVSYRFTVCLGRDCNGKQIRKYTTWPIPPDTSAAKAKKAAERAADIWEQELMSEYHKKLEAESAGKAYQIPAEKRHDDFVSFVNDVWFPLQVRDGKHKSKTIAFYESMTKLLLPCFRGSTLQGISSLDIQRCLTYLRTEHKNQHGKPLTPKTLHHLYNTLNLIFGFAEKQELLVKNPMKLVDSPKKEKKPVDALTEEQAKKFFSLLPDTPLDFHCILQLLITTGIRRGECMGLKWSDIDEKNYHQHRAEYRLHTRMRCNRQYAKNSDQHPHYPHHAKHIVFAQTAAKGNTIPTSQYHSEKRLSFSQGGRYLPAS